MMPKFLDFTDYRLTKTKIRNLEIQVNDLQERINNSTEVDEYYFKLISIIEPVQNNEKLIRLGSENDGGYIIPVRFMRNTSWITIGLGANVDFENELASLGNQVKSFDHTILSRPLRLSRLVTWYKIGWGSPKNSRELASLSDILRIAEIDLQRSWCLKFDIEGNEWDLISQIHNLNKLPSLICCEIHGLKFNPDYSNNRDRIEKLQLLLKHYECIYINGNNYSADLKSKYVNIHDIVELTLIKKDLLSVKNKKYLKTYSKINHLNNKIGATTYTLRRER